MALSPFASAYMTHSSPAPMSAAADLLILSGSSMAIAA